MNNPERLDRMDCVGVGGPASVVAQRLAAARKHGHDNARAMGLLGPTGSDVTDMDTGVSHFGAADDLSGK